MPATSKSSTPPIIRLAHPLAFAAFLRHVGAPVDRHFRRAGLPALCEDGNAFVSLQKAWSFFDATARSEDAMLGWHVGKFVGDHNLHAAFVKKLEQAPTLFLALQRLVRLISMEASHLQLGIKERDNDILIFTHYPDMKEVPGYTSSQSYQLAVYIEVVRHYIGSNWTPPEIGIEYPVVPRILKEQFPGSRILPRQRVGYVAVPRSCLHLPPPRNEFEESDNDRSLPLTNRFDYAQTLRALLQPHLSEGYPDASLAASLMDTSVRTLARRLEESGQTYRELIDDLRFTEARKILAETNTGVTDVAAAVGFDDPAHFARMFRRIGGLSPREFRRAGKG